MSRGQFWLGGITVPAVEATARSNSKDEPQTGTGAEAPAQLCPITIDSLLQRYGHGVARELVAEAEARNPKFVVPICKAAAWGGAAGRWGKCVVIPLVTKIDIQRFCAEQPAGIVDKLD